MMEKIRRLDNRILEYIQKRIRCPFLDKVMPKITLLGNGGLIWLVVTAVFLARKTERPYGFMLMVALVPVSYTHLDVYKRQDLYREPNSFGVRFAMAS